MNTATTVWEKHMARLSKLTTWQRTLLSAEVQMQLEMYEYNKEPKTEFVGGA